MIDYKKELEKALETIKSYKGSIITDDIIEKSFGILEEDKSIKEILLSNISSFVFIDEKTRERWISWIKNKKKETSKFKVGDWVVTECGDIAQVISIDPDYGYIFDNEIVGQVSFKKEDSLRLWNILDSKSGDILVKKTEDQEFPFIYSGSLIDQLPGGICGFSRVDGVRKFISKPELPWKPRYSCSNVYPATEDQRDELMKAIEESGYEWDSISKELKNKEIKNSRYNIGDWLVSYTNGKRNLIQISGISWGFKKYSYNSYETWEERTSDFKDIDICYHPWSKDDVKPGDILSDNNIDKLIVIVKDPWTKTIVSVRDEFLINDDQEIHLDIDSLHPASLEDRQELYRRIRNRRLQTDWDHSDMYREIKEILFDEPEDKSKSWKPSREQMDALFQASEQNNRLGSVLRSLYNDLRRCL